MNIRMTKLAIIIIAIVIIATAIVFAASTTISIPQPAQAAASAAAKTAGAAGTITSSIRQQTFRASLSGNEEVPPKDTQATGSDTFTLTTDENHMSYRIHVINIDKVTMAHIHTGKIGRNGPVVVTLFQSKATTSGPIKNGILSQGTINSANLEGPLKGKQIPDLVKLINDGNAYINVHTKQNPKGEIRGQISSVAAASASTSTGGGGSSSASAAASASAY